MTLLVIENRGGSRTYNVNFTIIPEVKVSNNVVVKDGNLIFIDKKRKNPVLRSL